MWVEMAYKHTKNQRSFWNNFTQIHIHTAKVASEMDRFQDFISLCGHVTGINPENQPKALASVDATPSEVKL
jgi:hypothetical protein